MRNFATFALLASCALVSGCVKLGSKPPASLLTVSADTVRTAGNEKTNALANRLVIGEIIAPQSLQTQRLLVTSGATQLAYLKDALWVDKPQALFRSLLSETIGAGSGWVVLPPTSAASSASYKLSGVLDSFGYDDATREAVVRFDATLTKADGSFRQQRFEARQPASAASPTQVASALNQASNKVASAVATWLAQ